MHFATALAASLAALNTASAFLIPPKATFADLRHKEEEAGSEIAHLLGLQTKWQIEMDCPDCRWANMDSDSTQEVGTRGYDTSLILEIEASNSYGLIINGMTTLPPHSDHPLPVFLSARQKRLDTGELTQPIPIDFVMEVLETITSEDPTKTIIPLQFTIVGFAGQRATLDTLAIDILQAPESMTIIRIQRVPFASTPGAKSCEGMGSMWSVCRVRALIRHHVLETVRIMRAKAHHAKAWVKHCGGGMRHGHAHHAHHRAHRWAKMLHSALRFFIIPALLGVIGGLLASAVGMLVGQCIVLLWTRFGRRTEQRMEVVEVVVRGDEKRGLLLGADIDEDNDHEEEDGLPEYEHAPRYEDVEAQVIVERKE